MAGLLRRFKNEERGAITFLIAVLIPVLAGMVALVFDLGKSWEDKRQVQNCADSAALAGAQELPDAVQATARADEYMAPCITPGAAYDVDVFDNDGDGSLNAIRLVVTRPRGYTFARLIGVNETVVGAAATAVKGDVLELKGMQPFSIIACDGPDAVNDCPYVGACPVDVTQLWIKNWNPLTDTYIMLPIIYYVPYTIKIGGGDPQLESGNFQALELGNPNDYYHNVEWGTNSWYGDCDNADTAPGNKAATISYLYEGPPENKPNQFWNGVDPEHNHMSRINRDLNHPDTDGDGVKWDQVWDSASNGGHDDVWDCPRLMYVPLVGNLQDKGGGKMEVQVLSYAVMFLEDESNQAQNKGYVRAVFLRPDSRLFKPDQWNDIGGLTGGAKPAGVKLVE